MVFMRRDYQVLEHIFARAELNTEAAAGDRGGESVTMSV